MSVVLKINGDSTMTGQFKAANGSAAAPSITFGTDANLGIYRISSDTLGVAANGALVATFDANGLTMASGAQFIATGGTLTEPDYTFAGDLNTGIFRPAADQVGITAGGTWVATLSSSGLGVTGTIDATGGFTVSGVPIAFTPPGGRLSAVAQTPVVTTNAVGVTAVFYTAYLNSFVSLYSGTAWIQKEFGNLSQTLADNTKSPGATVADTLYDMFLWDDAGTVRCTRGFPWSSSSSRGTGAGTAQISKPANGVWVNTVSITNGPAAGRGLYVGTIRTNSINQLQYEPVAAANTGGSDACLYVWNMYNRTSVSPVSMDNTNSWDYSTAAWRAANGSNSNRISFICGLQEDQINASYQGYTSGLAIDRSGFVGVGFSSTSSPTGTRGYVLQQVGGQIFSIRGEGSAFPNLGFNYVQALESGNGTPDVFFYGDNGNSSFYQMMLNFNWRM